MYELYDPTEKKKKEKKKGFDLGSVINLASAIGGKKEGAGKIGKLLHGDDGKSWEQEADELAEQKRKKKMQGQSYGKTMGFGKLFI